jgi:hypothetical protein
MLGSLCPNKPPIRLNKVLINITQQEYNHYQIVICCEEVSIMS